MHKIIRNVLTAMLLLTVLIFNSCKQDDPLPADYTDPFMNKVVPDSNATEVGRNVMVKVEFSEVKNSSNISTNTFTVFKGTTPIACRVSYNGTTATLIPNEHLDARAIPKATFYKIMKDVAGNEIEDKAIWNFTTGGDTAILNAIFYRKGESVSC